MLITSLERTNQCIKLVSQARLKCNRCDKEMHPYIKPWSTERYSEMYFVMAMCECGNHYKNLYDRIDTTELSL